jgi:transcriptional regulator of heat shock response
LESYRQLTKEATEYSREIIQRLTPETIKIIAGASPDFNNLVAQIGFNKVKDFLEAYLARLYVIDTNKFDDLANKIEAIKKAEQELQNIDNSLREACRKYGISESELAQIYERGGSEAEIQTLVYKRLNILQKVWDKLTGGNLAGERIKELKQIENIKSKIDEIHNYLIEVSQMIATAVFETQEGRTFLTKALHGQIDKPDKGVSFIAAASFYSEDLEREWEKISTRSYRKRDV